MNRITRLNSALFVCDIQERFRELIWKFPHVVYSAKMLMDGAKALNIPVAVTEQYPKAMKHTVHELDTTGAKVVEKTKFSMMVPEVEAWLKDQQRNHVILCGIESHVCVLQTCLDLKDKGLNVHLVVDGVSSMRKSDRSIALQRLKEEGIIMTSTESILFQILGDAKAENFKDISNIAKVPRPSDTEPLGFYE
mmetsp:Transcript_32851/g.84842  ORF Transcript_32851/g.84842 Transcript_32851/m.84842 type:complete len:193 (-) Transcript_32851:364-942(-)